MRRLRVEKYRWLWIWGSCCWEVKMERNVVRNTRIHFSDCVLGLEFEMKYAAINTVRVSWLMTSWYGYCSSSALNCPKFHFLAYSLLKLAYKLPVSLVLVKIWWPLFVVSFVAEMSICLILPPVLLIKKVENRCSHI